MSSTKKRKLIIIGGPTAVGKTSLSIEVAKYFQTAVVSSDSRQVYKHLNIGTAKPTKEEMQGVKHYLIDMLNLEEKISAGQWVVQARIALSKTWTNSNIAVVAGGTGFYIRSLLDGLDDFPEVDGDIVDGLNIQFREEGIESLQRELFEKDPVYFDQIEQKNPHRLIRALSVIRQTNQPFSQFLLRKSEQKEFDVCSICLTRERDNLYGRINQRVDQMLENGLLDEVKELRSLSHLQSLQTVGYQEFFPYFEGGRDLNEAVRLVKRNSRRYAKRQLTWFRNQGEWLYLPAEKADLSSVIKILNNL